MQNGNCPGRQECCYELVWQNPGGNQSDLEITYAFYLKITFRQKSWPHWSWCSESRWFQRILDETCALGSAISTKLQCHQIEYYTKLFSHELLRKPSSLVPQILRIDGSLCLAYHEGCGSKLEISVYLKMVVGGSICSNLGASLNASLGWDLLLLGSGSNSFPCWPSAVCPVDISLI